MKLHYAFRDKAIGYDFRFMRNNTVGGFIRRQNIVTCHRARERQKHCKYCGLQRLVVTRMSRNRDNFEDSLKGYTKEVINSDAMIDKNGDRTAGEKCTGRAHSEPRRDPGQRSYRRYFKVTRLYVSVLDKSSN